ncbi:transposase [Hymenobacter sp. UYP22]
MVGRFDHGARLEKRGGRHEKKAQCLGRSRGGLTTKLHVVCDGAGTPLALLLSAGQRHDAPQFEPLCEQVSTRRRPRQLIADCRQRLRRSAHPPLAASAPHSCGHSAAPSCIRPALPPTWPSTAHGAAPICPPQRRGALFRFAQGAPPRGHSLRQTRRTLPQHGAAGVHSPYATTSLFRHSLEPLIAF